MFKPTVLAILMLVSISVTAAPRKAAHRRARPAPAPLRCFEQSNICVGKTIYVYADGKLQKSIVLDFTDATVKTVAGEVPVRDAARTGAAGCATDALRAKLCAGDSVSGGKVVGVFPTGYVVFEDAITHEVTSRSGASYTRIAAAPAVLPATKPNLASAVAAISKVTGPAAKPAAKEIAYFTALLARADSAPIEDFLKLWYPNDVVPAVGEGYLKECYKWGSVGGLVHVGNQVAPNCNPDVVYSWGPLGKLENLRKEMSDAYPWGEFLNAGRTVWATISPSATFSYGLIPVRLKIKATAPWIFTLTAPPGAVADHMDYLHDILFNRTDVIESWSFGTPQHYDEIIKDIRRFMTSERVVGYVPTKGGEGLGSLYAAGVPERGPQDETTLRRNLTEMIKTILSGRGEIHYAQGVTPSAARHFSTNRPTYFNER